MNILMYHFVSSQNDHQLFSGMHSVKVETFEKQIISLKKKGTPLSSDDINSAVLNRDYPSDDFFYLTFADGFKQHFTNVYPVIKDYNLEASFFVPTMAIESRKCPIVEKQRLLQYNLYENYDLFLKNFCNQVRKFHKFSNDKFFYPDYENIKKCTKYLKQFTFYSDQERYFRFIRNEHLTSREFSIIIDFMFSKFFKTDNEFIEKYYLSETDLSIMSKNKMIIGGHTYSHPFLNKLSSKKIEIEVKRNISYLSSVINQKIRSFAYPFGAFNKNVIRCMENNNFDYAFDTRTKGDNNKYNIRRNDVKFIT